MTEEYRDPLEDGDKGRREDGATFAVIGRLYANDLLPILHSPLLVLILLRVAMGIAALAAAIICGYFGWKIGKRLYREYEAPNIKYRGYNKSKAKEARNNL